MRSNNSYTPTTLMGINALSGPICGTWRHLVVRLNHQRFDDGRTTDKSKTHICEHSFLISILCHEIFGFYILHTQIILKYCRNQCNIRKMSLVYF